MCFVASAYFSFEQVKFEKILDEYCRAGKFYVRTGYPTRPGPEALNLKDMANALEKME